MPREGVAWRMGVLGISSRMGVREPYADDGVAGGNCDPGSAEPCGRCELANWRCDLGTLIVLQFV